MKYQRVLTEIYRKPWAVLPETLAIINEIIGLRAAGGKLSEEEIHARIAPQAERRREPQMKLLAARNGQGQDYGVVALIPVYGVISHRISLMSQISGGTSIERLTSQFRQALADPSVKAIVFDVDSPGGTVDGVPEFAEEIYKSRSKKKTVAVANSMAASAAYWIASAADEMVVIPSGHVGSIGVYGEHTDMSGALEKAGIKVSMIKAGKYKGEGVDYEPLTDEARAAFQKTVDAYYEMFVKSVAKGRGVSQASVRDGFGEGRMVLAADALKQKMVDGVDTLDATLGRLGAGSAPKKMAAADARPRISADAPDGDPDPDEMDECECACAACEAGDCSACENAECTDAMCAAAGCPMQASAKANSSAMAAMERRRRELDLHK